MFKNLISGILVFGSVQAYASELPFCLDKRSNERVEVTAKRLTVVQNYKIDGVNIDLYSIPVWESVAPYTEGCMTDARFFIYEAESNTPLFLEAGDLGNFEVVEEANEIQSLKKMFSRADDADFAIKAYFLGNCGGCYYTYFFANDPEFSYLGKSYFRPAKYGDEPAFIEYDPEDVRVAVYGVE